MTRRQALIIVSFLAVLLAPHDVLSGMPSLESLVPKNVPDGWAVREAPETFTRETLFEHIDGQAELFIQYGFNESVFALFRKANASDDKIDVDIYDMGNSLQAFGVFSRFRQDESPAGFGLDSYLGDQYAIFYKGKYFVVLQATDSNPSILKRLAQEIESRILDKSPPPKEIAYFPKTGLKPGSIEYFPNGLLGHQFLKRGFKASYVENDGKKNDAKIDSEGRDSYLFLSIFDNSQEATSALKLFRENLSKKGKLETGVANQFGPDALIGADPYQGKTIVVQKGPCLIGAIGFEQVKEAASRLDELMKEIK
jgi:Family of unknown function (DUF6599)